MRTHNARLGFLVAVLAGVALPLVAPTPAGAATLMVTSANDAGAGTLRAAVSAAAPGDTITFSSALIGVPLQVTSAEIVIDKNLTLRGNGGSTTLIAGTPAGVLGPRIFHVTAGTVVIDGVGIVEANSLSAGVGVRVDPGATLTFSRGFVQKALSAANAGAIENSGQLRMTNTVITLNEANNCAGISNGGKMQVIDSLVLNNTVKTTGDAAGGGICNSGELVLAYTDVRQNQAISSGPAGSASGGGIHQFSGSLVMSDGTIGSNLAQAGGAPALAQGAGLHAAAGTFVVLNRVEVSNNLVTSPGGTNRLGGGIFSAGTLSMTNSTVAINETQMGTGGGFYNAFGGNATIRSSTLASNFAAFGTAISNGASASTQNSIFASGPGTDPCDGPMNGIGTNLGNPGIECPGMVGDPLLGILQNHGGPTRTMALAAASPAINAGAGCPAVDQRQYPRNVGACDLGAYEFGSTLNDVTPPVCFISAVRSDNPNQTDVTVQDASSGLAELNVTLVQNAAGSVPVFQPGTRNPVVVTFTKVNQAQPMQFAFTATDKANNSRPCP